MACPNHPDRGATQTCSGCGAAFCEGCLVRFEKLQFCAGCKARYLVGVDEGPRPPSRPGAAAARRPELRATTPAPGGRPLHWVLGAAALLFAGVFLLVIVARLAEPWQALAKDRRLAEAFDRLAQVGAALERYRADKGAYPDTLDALVPAYLTRIPDDPYAGAPPRYASEPSRRLWSVGPDRKDDDGEETLDLVYVVEPSAGG